LRDAPDLARTVKAAAMSLFGAYETYEERQRIAKQQARTAEHVKEYADAIANDEITTGQALAAIMEQEESAPEVLEVPEAAKIKDLPDEDLSHLIGKLNPWLVGFLDKWPMPASTRKMSLIGLKQVHTSLAALLSTLSTWEEHLAAELARRSSRR
jgi:hypothetical protein